MPRPSRQPRWLTALALAGIFTVGAAAASRARAAPAAATGGAGETKTATAEAAGEPKAAPAKPSPSGRSGQPGAQAQAFAADRARADAAAASAGEAAPAGTSGRPDQPVIDFEQDAPPPTAYDQLGQGGQPSLAPESFALIRQLGRTVLALLFTCALIYLFFRLGLPRLTNLWSNAGEQTLRIRERVALDGSNQLVRLESDSGETYLLGVGSAGIKLIDRWEAPPGGPMPGPRRARSQFAEALKGTPTGPGDQAAP